MANETARALRKRMTPHEVKLWVKLRELKALGFHFRRQAPIGSCIVDFASFGSRLVIEVDGGQHGCPKVFDPTRRAMNSCDREVFGCCDSGIRTSTPI